MISDASPERRIGSLWARTVVGQDLNEILEVGRTVAIKVSQTWWRGWGACTSKGGVIVEAAVTAIAFKDTSATGTADRHGHAVGVGSQVTRGDSRATGFTSGVTSEQNCCTGTLGFWGDDESNTWDPR